MSYVIHQFWKKAEADKKRVKDMPYYTPKGKASYVKTSDGRLYRISKDGKARLMGKAR